VHAVHFGLLIPGPGANKSPLISPPQVVRAASGVCAMIPCPS
jgi:hypothetical protein